jgi:hypothetical protein
MSQQWGCSRFLAALGTLALTRKLLSQTAARGSEARGMPPELSLAGEAGPSLPDPDRPAQPRRPGARLAVVA